MTNDCVGAWINQRMRSIEVRKHLTDEWKRAGLEEGQQFASLTDIIYRGWSCLSVVSPMNAKQIA